MRPVAFSLALVAFSASWLATATLPTTVAAPDGDVPGKRACSVGRANRLTSYNSDMGCLLANVALACLSKPGIAASWAKRVNEAALELAHQAAPLDQAPERLYLEAASLALKPVRLSAATEQTKANACAAARSAAEYGCLAYYCSTANPLRAASTALNETTSAIQQSCGETVRCLPKDLDVDRNACNAAWEQQMANLKNLTDSKYRAIDGHLSPPTVAAVDRWQSVTTRSLDTLKEQALTGELKAGAAPDLALQQAAAPALLAVEKETSSKVRKALQDAKARANWTAFKLSCDPSTECRLKHDVLMNELKSQEARLQLQEQIIQNAEAAKTPAERIEILSAAPALSVAEP